MLTGKPCMLKCHIGQCLRAARPILMGRQIDSGGQLPEQINDSHPGNGKQNPAYRLVAFLPSSLKGEYNAK